MITNDCTCVPELRDILKGFNIKTDQRRVHFWAALIVRTEKNNIRINMSGVQIIFAEGDTAATIYIYSDALDAGYFPTVLNACAQRFTVVQQAYLLIEGMHDKDPRIGRYSIRIAPNPLCVAGFP